jgi:phosphoserine phosphatase RsbU/P
MIRIKSLQQRLALFLLLPVAISLFAMIYLGFSFARESLLKEWREVVILRLARSAHFIDMRLSHPKEWLQMYLYATGDAYPDTVQQRLVERLRGMEGVERVNITWLDGKAPPPGPGGSGFQQGQGRHGMGGGGKGGMHSRRGAPIEIISPHYDAGVEHQTVSLVADLAGEKGELLGKLEVSLRFDYLVEDIKSSKWWQADRAFLVDQTGRVLFCNDPEMRKQLGSDGNPLELATLEAMRQQRFGTLHSQGHPPKEVSAYLRLKEAPWTLVVIAPGREILAPIIRFRNYFFAGGALSVLFILVLMRLVTGRTVSSIKAVARAAENIATGAYTPLIPAKTQDEVGQLIESFNTMALQLEERIRLKEALDLAMQVQQSLLPQESPQIDGLDIAGKSIYCDETGGDYYDFLEFSELDGRLGVVVGDVAGHGIAAALIMATVRSLLRSRITQPGTLSEVIADVNRLLCLDTSQTASFMTLFFMLADRVKKEINWVRAGHDPAIVYDPATDSFSELRGGGIALGVDETLAFHEYAYDGWTDGQIIVIGTDGIWEAESDEAVMFGKERLRELIREHRNRSAREILQTITDALSEFRRTAPQQDDITLVVVKMESLQKPDPHQSPEVPI